MSIRPGDKVRVLFLDAMSVGGSNDGRWSGCNFVLPKMEGGELVGHVREFSEDRFSLDLGVSGDGMEKLAFSSDQRKLICVTKLSSPSDDAHVKEEDTVPPVPEAKRQRVELAPSEGPI